MVDDSADATEMTRTLLELHGFEVCVAADAAAALIAARAFGADVGLFDLGLPGTDGFQLARLVRGDAETSRMFLIALTGWGTEEVRRSAFAAGFDAHLTKPVDPDALLRLIAG